MKINLFVIPVEVKSMEECEKVEFVVCALVSEWNKDFPTYKYSIEKCCGCGKEVYFTPSSSPKTPKKICVHCALHHSKVEKTKGEQSVTE